MPLLELSFAHGRTLDEARSRMAEAVDQTKGILGTLVHDVRWSEDRNSARISGSGFRIDLAVDAERVHLEGDLPFLARFLAPGLKGILEQTFQKKIQA